MSLLLRRGIISSPSSFAPEDSLVWWDASDTGTITGSPAVSQIDDKIGTQHLVQGTGSEKPNTGTRTHNSLNVLDFDGSDFMDKTSFPIPSSGNVAFYGVFGIDSVNDVNDSLFSINAATNDFQFQAGNVSDFRAEANVNGSGSNIAAFATNKNGPSIYEFIFDFTGAAEFTVFVDGVENPNGPNAYTTKLDASQTFALMNNRNQNSEPNGFFGEMLILENANLGARAYLKEKWNTP